MAKEDRLVTISKPGPDGERQLARIPRRELAEAREKGWTHTTKSVWQRARMLKAKRKR